MDTAGFVFHLILFHSRGTATILQCHLVMGVKWNILLQITKEVEWLANSKCVSMKKLYEAAGA